MGALYSNWGGSSIGRPGGIIWIDLWMVFIKLSFLNNIYGFYFYRFATFALMLLSVIFFLRFLFQGLSKQFSYLLGNFFFFIYCAVTSIEYLNAVYGVDISLYGINLVYILIIIICLLRIYNNQINKLTVNLYFIFLLIYLNSSYSHLVVTPFLITFGLFSNKEILTYLISPRFFFKKLIIKKKNFIYNKNFIFIISFIIYFISVWLNLASPSLNVRQTIWPSNIPILSGVKNSLATLEWLFIYVWGYKYVFISIISFLLCIKYKSYNNFNYLFLISLIFLAPVIAFITNTLTYTSLSLHGGHNIVSQPLFLFQSIAHYGNEPKTILINGLAPRHIFYINHIAIISYLFAGILFSKIFIRK